MATGRFNGWLWVNDGTSTFDTAFIANVDGLTSQKPVPVTGVYIWEGINECVVQFKVNTGAVNLEQAGWEAFVGGASGKIGSRGDAFGIFEIAIGGTAYLFIPTRCFGYFDGKQTINIWATCPKYRVR